MEERLKILLENNVISKETYDFIFEIQNKYLSHMSLIESNDKEQMFWTHLAIAIDRALKGTQLNEVDDTIKEEIVNQDNYGQANELVEIIEEHIKIDFSEAERTYILLHTCNILMEEK